MAELFATYQWATEEQIRDNSRGVQTSTRPVVVNEKEVELTTGGPAKRSRRTQAPLAQWRRGFDSTDPPRESTIGGGRIALCYRHKKYRVFFPKPSKGQKVINAACYWKLWGGWKEALQQAETFYALHAAAYNEQQLQVK